MVVIMSPSFTVPVETISSGGLGLLNRPKMFPLYIRKARIAAKTSPSRTASIVRVCDFGASNILRRELYHRPQKLFFPSGTKNFLYDITTLTQTICCGRNFACHNTQ